MNKDDERVVDPFAENTKDDLNNNENKNMDRNAEEDEKSEDEEEYVEEVVPSTIINIDSSKIKEYSAEAYRSPFPLKEPKSKAYNCQKVFEGDENNPIDLISVHFNGYDCIYLLAYASDARKLYVAQFNCNNNEFSKTRPIPVELSEVMSDAVISSETPEQINYYVQGKEKIWKLELLKPNFNISDRIKAKNTLLAFDNTLYPFNKKGDPARNLEDSTLLIYNQLPVLIGGKDFLVKGNNLARRLIIAASWQHESDESSKLILGSGYVKDNFLIEKRQSPLCCIASDRLICMGGNLENPNNIAESFDLLNGLSQTNISDEINMNQLIISSFYNEALDNALNGKQPRTLHCFHNNFIYIFPKEFKQETPLSFFRFNLSNRQWQVFGFTENIAVGDLRYSSARAIVFDNFIFLFLFSNTNKYSKTKIAVLKISLLSNN